MRWWRLCYTLFFHAEHSDIFLLPVELMQRKGDQRHRARAFAGIVEQALSQTVLQLQSGGLGRPIDHLVNGAHTGWVKGEGAAIAAQQPCQRWFLNRLGVKVGTQRNDNADTRQRYDVI